MPPPDEKAKKPKPPDEPADWHGKRRAKPSASGAAWQSSVRGLPDAQRSRPRALRLFLTGLLLVLVAVFVYLWGRTVSPTPLITFAFTDYQLPLPPNAWAFEDWDRFRIGSRPVSSRSNLAWIGLDTKDGPAPSQEAWLVRLKEKVENAKPEKGLPILVYLSAHGAVDDAGRPCLIAPGNESDRQNWSSVEDLVNALGNAAPKHKVVLFLDANRLPGHWALGLLYNDFADRLPSALDAAQAKNVLIVNSTSPGQVGWTSHKQGGSIFALCVLNGLRREASSNGKVVTLDDLLRFVRARGGDWAKTYRGVPQTPFLIPRDAKTDFKLAEVPSLWQEQFLAWITNKRSDEPAADRTDQFDEKIKKKLKEAEPLWDKLAKFAEAGGPSETFFEALRLRCELAHWQQRMAAGDREAELVKDDLEGLATRIRALEKATAEPPMSFSLWRNQVAPKLEEWRQCCASATVAELCKTIPTSATGGPEPIEWRWARLLADDQALRPAANEVLPLALNQRNLAEKAAWPRDARAYYAVRAYLDMVDEQRRGADDALFLGELKEAKSVYGDAKARYESAAELGEAISSAYRARNRAMYKLLDLAPSIDLALRFSNVGRMSQHGHDLLDVIEDARLLRDELEHIVNAKYDPPPDDPNELRMDSTWFRSQAEKLHDKGKDLSLTVDRLTAKLNSLAKWHEKTALNDGPDALWDLALSPAPAVVGGGEVLKRFYELVENEQRLNFDRLTPEERKQVERNEAQDEQAPRRQADGDANAKSDGPTSEAPRPPTWSRHPAAAILGLPKEAKTDAADYDQRRTAFHKQGREVFERLAFLRKKAVSAPSTREPLADDEAQILAAAELLAELALSDGSRSFVGCALQLARFDRGRFLTWQAQRALGDFWGPRAWQQEARDEPYYRQLAQAMLNEAGTPLDAASDLRKKLDRKYEFKLDLEEPDAPDTSSNRADGASMAIVKWNYTFQPPPPKGRAALFLLGADQNSPSAGQRRSVDLSPSDLPPSHEQEIELAGTTDTSTLRLLFRGHVDDQRVPRRRARPKRQIVHTGTKNADVTIKVRQEEPLDLQVVFLLDCSGSMESAGKKLKAFLNGKNGPTRM
ncbi:MAG TPA: caspase family protein, partial [Pirellulales bacterium]|nr:caspase family protein [Pirellulales bacterium]